MNFLDSSEQLLLFVYFVVPGLISIKAYELYYPSQKKEASRLLIDSITFSCINYVFSLWIINFVETSPVQFRENLSFLYYLAYVFVLFISPVLLVVIWKKIRESDRFKSSTNNLHPIEKPWDYFFSQGQCCFVKVTMKNGDVIGGRYAAQSFASSAPAEESIYLEERWLVKENGAFERPVDRTLGVLILASEISHIEFKN
ncbi:hypothetical protein KW477_00235 [Vibrio fluvialis]|nr:hypothetical protein [Vibrio fluvialis]MBY8036389.1 hypothetical protein [Vibrio fluvialis]